MTHECNCVYETDKETRRAFFLVTLSIVTTAFASAEIPSVIIKIFN